MSDIDFVQIPDGARAHHPRLTIALTVGAIVIAATTTFSQVRENTASIRAFIDATQQYASMHRRLERQIGPIELNTTPEQINRFIQTMAAAVRAERADARQGDLFTSDVAPELRGRISDALLENGVTAADVRAEAFARGVDPYGARLRVNATFPWVLSVPMFPCILEALPPLPPELQYRIVGNDLLMIDLHAGLIVDIMPSALTELTVLVARSRDSESRSRSGDPWRPGKKFPSR